MNSTTASKETAIADTVRWLERAVIGLNLCPFARAVHVARKIHFSVSDAQTPVALLEDLIFELKALQAHTPQARETTLLIAPRCFGEFLDFNDFLDAADAALESLDLVGVVQVANFHPRYRFAGSDADDIANATNRAPYPTLHLLREDSIERALQAFSKDPDSIYEANIATLKRLGAAGWAALDVGPRAAAKKGRA